MSFFRRLFGKSQPEEMPTPEFEPSPHDSELVKFYDKYGRTLEMPRSEWRDKVLLPNLKASWNDADKLYGFIASAFQDGYFREVLPAAERLSKIDLDSERGAVTLAVACQNTDQTDRAETILREYISSNGKTAVVLSNLAQVELTLGRKEASLQTLWDALTYDPNFSSAFNWYVSVAKEQEGDSGELSALQRISALPGSWRAQIWLARRELENENSDEALVLYRKALATCGSPAPIDALQQISGDLGKQGHLIQIIELVAPYYDYKRHGLEVGNNLLKAFCDLGQLDQARRLLTQLQTLQRPDLQEHLDFWENEITKAEMDVRPSPQEEIKVEVIPVPGPIWLRADHPIVAHFPPKSGESLTIGFSGCSVDKPNPPKGITATRSDSSGRFSRSLPLYLSERFALETDLSSKAFIPWFITNGGGFIVTGGQSSPESIAHLGRITSASGQRVDYVFDSHIVTQGENWTVQMRLIRTIDEETVWESEYKLPENGFHNIAQQLLSDLYQAISQEIETALAPSPPAHTEIKGSEIDHYLLRLEQNLAARCAVNLGPDQAFIHNPSEIISGCIHLCIQNPDHLPSRFVLWRTLDAAMQTNAELAQSFAQKATALHEDFPIDHPAYPELADEIAGLFETK